MMDKEARRIELSCIETHPIYTIRIGLGYCWFLFSTGTCAGWQGLKFTVYCYMNIGSAHAQERPAIPHTSVSTLLPIQQLLQQASCWDDTCSELR